MSLTFIAASLPPLPLSPPSLAPSLLPLPSSFPPSLPPQLAEEAGVPPGVFNVVTSSAQSAPSVGITLSTSPLVSNISFTGSTAVGRVSYHTIPQLYTIFHTTAVYHIPYHSCIPYSIPQLLGGLWPVHTLSVKIYIECNA